MLALVLTACCIRLLDSPVLVAEGTASYYTRQSGTVTASGEPFDENAFTCAMREGAFCTLHLVVSEDGRSVLCRLNDRGPYAPDRIIDLSKGAMERLGATERGLVQVQVFRFDSDSIRIRTPARLSRKLQICRFRPGTSTMKKSRMTDGSGR